MIHLNEIWAGDPRGIGVLVFFNGVLAPKDWNMTGAIAGDNGSVFRSKFHPDGNYVIKDGKVAQIEERGRVSIRVPE